MRKQEERLGRIYMALAAGAVGLREVSEMTGLSKTEIHRVSVSNNLNVPRACFANSHYAAHVKPLLGKGKTIGEIADNFEVSEATILNYLEKIDGESFDPIGKKAMERIEKISDLAGRGFTREDIANQLDISYRSLCRLAKDSGIKIKRKFSTDRNSKVADSDLLDLAREGLTLEEIGNRFDCGRENIRQLLEKRKVNDNGIERTYAEIRKEARASNIQRNSIVSGVVSGVANFGKNIVSEILSGALKHSYEASTWAEQRALDYINTGCGKRSISFDALTEFFDRYDEARNSGKRRSIGSLSEGLFHQVRASQILQTLNLPTLVYSKNRKKRVVITEEKKEALKRAVKTDFSGTDISYFVDVPIWVARDHLRRNGRKASKTGVIRRSWSGDRDLTRSLASEIYEASDVGYFDEFTKSEMAGFFETSEKIIDYSLDNRKEISKGIIRGLKKIFPDLEIEKPYIEYSH